MNLIKVGNKIINLDQVQQITDLRSKNNGPVLVYLAACEEETYLTGEEADALMAFLEDAATDASAWLEVKAEDEPIDEAPTSPAPRYHLLINPNTDEEEDGAWLTPDEARAFNGQRRVNGDDRRWLLASECAEEPA